LINGIRGIGGSCYLIPALPGLFLGEGVVESLLFLIKLFSTGDV